MWIGDYMAREGINAAELAARAREYDRLANGNAPGRITGALIMLLEEERGNGYTLPRFADAIAAVCGATSDQRDSIVAERHRGKWRRTKDVQERAREAVRRAEARRFKRRPAAFAPETPPAPGPNIRPVVMVDRAGNVVHRFDSVTSAAAYTGTTTDAVGRRARRQIAADEFGQFGGHTFRFANEWEAMPAERRAEDLRRTVKPKAAPPAKKQRGGARYHKSVTVIDPDGTVASYPSVNAAAAATGLTASTVSNRLTLGGQDRWGRRYAYTANTGGE